MRASDPSVSASPSPRVTGLHRRAPSELSDFSDSDQDVASDPNKDGPPKSAVPHVGRKTSENSIDSDAFKHPDSGDYSLDDFEEGPQPAVQSPGPMRDPVVVAAAAAPLTHVEQIWNRWYNKDSEFLKMSVDTGAASSAVESSEVTPATSVRQDLHMENVGKDLSVVVVSALSTKEIV